MRLEKSALDQFVERTRCSHLAALATPRPPRGCRRSFCGALLARSRWPSATLGSGEGSAHRSNNRLHHGANAGEKTIKQLHLNGFAFKLIQQTGEVAELLF